MAESGPRNQSQNFQIQSERFVRTHIQDYPAAPDWFRGHPTLLADPPASILDVGCGPGYFLQSLVDTFNATKGVGIEPSPVAAAVLGEHWKTDHRLTFRQGFAHELPYESDSFDLVVCWSVLHWVGRNEYLQSLGELLRVARTYLVVMDFVPLQHYRVRYRHDPRLFTYKMDFTMVIMNSGLAELLDSERWW